MPGQFQSPSKSLSCVRHHHRYRKVRGTQCLTHPPCLENPSLPNLKVDNTLSMVNLLKTSRNYPFVQISSCPICVRKFGYKFGKTKWWGQIVALGDSKPDLVDRVCQLLKQPSWVAASNHPNSLFTGSNSHFARGLCVCVP